MSLNTTILTTFAVIVLATSAFAFYNESSPVVVLTESNFQSLVMDDNAIWIVKFYAPWSGHCKVLAPRYAKAAYALQGMVKMGAVDMTEHTSIGDRFGGVPGYPTIMIFGENKNSPINYGGPRDTQDLVDAAFNEMKKTASARLSDSSSDGQPDGGQKIPPPKVQMTTRRSSGNFNAITN